MLSSSSDHLEVGAPAPSLSVTLDNQEVVELSTLYEKGPVLLFFYPKADTPGCTKQACNLRDEFKALTEANLQVLGVSRDSVKKQAAFRAKYSLPYPLIADPEGALGKAFKVGGYLGLAYKRESYLVVDGKVAWMDRRAKPGSQAADALKALAEL
ncbi:MAG: peroxiredoxin [Puniceicoccaceae bacterium]